MHPYHDVQEYLENHLSENLHMLRQMVEINSFTANPESVNKLGAFTTQAFTQLGFQAEAVQSVNPRYGKHIFLSRAGKTTVRSIAMVSHLDTVFPPEEEVANHFTWRVEGERIYGPGTVDIKGGTVMIFMLLDALRSFAPQVFEETRWIVCLDASEEALSVDFGALCLQRFPKDTAACLIFEGGTIDPGAIPVVTARKGRTTYHVKVEGKAAHAGNNHSQGANAIVQLAHTIHEIAALTDYKRQLTFNVGKVLGGSVVNRVPHRAEARVEMRAFSPQVFEEGVAGMLGLNGDGKVRSKDGYHCKVSVEMGESTAPWPPNPQSEILFNLWAETGATLGMRVIREQRGGLSDGNLLWMHHPTLDGLGPAGENAHCSERSADSSKEQEYVLASSFVPKALLNYAAILKLAGSSIEP